MANGVSGNFAVSGTNGIAARLYYSQSYDAGTNRSVIRIDPFQLASSWYSGVVYYPNGTIKVDGVAVVTFNAYNGTHSASITALNTYAKVNGTPASPWEVTVEHDGEGKKEITISVDLTGSTKSGGASWSLSANKTVTLTTIPRASAVTPGGTGQMGKALALTISRASASFTHTLRYAFGSASGTIATGVGTAYNWTIPTALVAQIPNATSGSGTVYCDTYSGATLIGTSTAAFIAKAPEETAPAAEDGNMGEEMVIGLPRAVSAYTHALTYSFAGQGGSIGSGFGTEAAWLVPLELAALIPAAASGVATITCATYNGTAKVGEKSIHVTLAVPDNEDTKPTAAMTLTAVGELDAAFAGLYIRGKTAVQADFDASSRYSAIDSYAMTVEGQVYEGDPALSGVLAGSGSVMVSGVAADRRGYCRTVQEEITVIPYDRPRVVPYTGESKVVCARCKKDGSPNPKGEYLLIKAGRKYSAVTAEGVQHNFCGLRYRHKAASAEDYSDWQVLMEKGETGTDMVIAVLADIVPAVKVAYTVQIMAEDDIGEFNIVTIPVPAAIVPIHAGEGGRNAAIGQYCDYSHTDALDIGFTTYFNTGIHQRVIFQEDGGWAEGQALEEVSPEADVVAVGLYSVFVAVTGGDPVLCLRLGGSIFGSYTDGTIRMTYSQDGEGNSSLMLDAAGGKTITALYALL